MYIHSMATKSVPQWLWAGNHTHMAIFNAENQCRHPSDDMTATTTLACRFSVAARPLGNLKNLS